MIGSLFSLLITLYFYFHPLQEKIESNIPLLSGVLIIIASLIFFSQILISVFALSPLQRSEERHSPRLMETFSKDTLLKGLNALLIVFLLFTFIVIADLLVVGFFNKTILLMAWTISLGLAIDSLHHIFKRVQNYLNPFFVLKQTYKKMRNSIQDEKTGDVFQWIDTLSQTAMQSITHSQIALCQEAIDQLHHSAKTYLQASKSISQGIEEGQADLIGYTLYYLYQRMEMIFELALDKKFEPLLNHIISSLGKITLETANLDLTLATAPITLMGKLALKGEQAGFEEIAARTQMTFLEVARLILQEKDLAYFQLKEPFGALISSMSEIAKMSFRMDKKQSIPILLAPFHQLKNFFSQETAKNHQDTPLIVSKIERVLQEFQALEDVLKMMPPMPNLAAESEANLPLPDEETPS